MKPAASWTERAFWPAWCVAGLALVALAPSQIHLATPFWRLPPEQAAQVPLLGVAFLVLALAGGPPDGRRPRLAAHGAMGAALFAAAFLLARARPDMEASRVVALYSAGLGVLLAYLPFVLRRRIPALAALVVASAAFAIAGPRVLTKPPRQVEADRVVATALNAVSISYLSGVAPPGRSDGGGLARFGDGFILATGRGDILRLEWEPGRNALRSTPLGLASPLDRAGFEADLPPRPRPSAADPRGDRPMPWEIFRVTDIALPPVAEPALLYVAHMHWNRVEKCITLRVSVADLPARSQGPGAPSAWRTVYESNPCLARTPIYEGTESGGRLAWTHEGRLLLTLGDFGFDGANGPPFLAQDPGNDYGKVVALDLAGGREPFTLGHRNPQGLAVDSRGRIWSTEHGPQGGDELNLLARGGNYGWPYATHGTQYGRAFWPVAKPAGAGPYVEPVHAFTPAIAPSNLISLGPGIFPQWENDLMVSSLSAQSLYRVRLAGDRVAYVEQIKIGRRIRDLEQARDGRIVLWTDEGEVVVLAPAPREAPGILLYGMCSRCHEPSAGGPPVAPGLRGVAGNDIAAQAGFPYSSALAGLEGSWTDEKLDAFLRDPAGFVPGTTMAFAGLPDPDERAALIHHLRTYR